MVKGCLDSTTLTGSDIQRMDRKGAEDEEEEGGGSKEETEEGEQRLRVGAGVPSVW